MKKIVYILLSALLVLGTVAGAAACGKKDKITIAVPNDTTNEARALLLLEDLGLITLKDGAGITATARDIKDNPYNIEIKEIEAAQIPNVRKDVDLAIINSNYAIEAGLNPVKDSLAMEGSAAAYANIVCVKQGNENEAWVKALVAAVKSQKVVDFINKKYAGSVVSTVDNPTDGYDSSVDYAALAGKKIKIGATPNPHAEILAIAKEILAAKNITLEIVEFTDYVQPNTTVESGDIDANYFQHVPYLDDFNKENNTHIVSVAAIHNEPMGIYSGKKNALPNK